MLVKSRRASSPAEKPAVPKRAIADLLRSCVIVVDKPSGPTSHQVTSWVAQMFGGVKAAHGGTL
ncbi:MAG TPA: RNA-guided pseudouridylation complex pseudouridine synthase subunit Cbf5, partial [Thermoplasmata archaeon]